MSSSDFASRRRDDYAIAPKKQVTIFRGATCAAALSGVTPIRDDSAIPGRTICRRRIDPTAQSRDGAQMIRKLRSEDLTRPLPQERGNAFLLREFFG